MIFRSPALQLRSYGCRVACRRVPTERRIHWHSILFMRAGRFVRWSHGGKALIDQNTVGLLNAGEDHTVWHPDLRGDQVTEMELLPSILQEIVAANDHDPARSSTRPFTSVACPIDTYAYQVHWEIWRAAMRPESVDPLAVEEATIDLATHVVRVDAARRGVAPKRCAERASTSIAHATLVHDAKLMLSTRYDDALDLQHVASAVHTSPYHLCRVFRRGTGMTIHQYLTALRLRASLEPLTDSSTPLARLAIDLGFSSQSHFTRQFRRAFGRTPGSVRRATSTTDLREMSKKLQDPPTS